MINRQGRIPTFAERFRLHVIYAWRHHRYLNLRNPRSFTELVQWRKLFDRDPRMPSLADKLAVKQHVGSLLGPEWVLPTLWSGTVLPEIPPCAPPFVVKARHGCNQTEFVLDEDFDWDAIHARARKWMRSAYGFWLDEWLYRGIPRGLLIEPYIGRGRELPVDYKFYVFGGAVRFIQVHLGRSSNHRWMQFDRRWRRVSASTADPDPAPPRSLAAMIAAAEKLGRGHDFLRVDFYEPAGKPVFGEITFYPGSGLDPFDPVSLDKTIGAEWLKVRSARPPDARPSHEPAPARDPEWALAR